MPSNHLSLCHSLLLLPSIFPSITVFSNELLLHKSWPKNWSLSFRISPSNEYSGLTPGEESGERGHLADSWHVTTGAWFGDGGPPWRLWSFETWYRVWEVGSHWRWDIDPMYMVWEGGHPGYGGHVTSGTRSVKGFTLETVAMWPQVQGLGWGVRNVLSRLPKCREIHGLNSGK